LLERLRKTTRKFQSEYMPDFIHVASVTDGQTTPGETRKKKIAPKLKY
jgi:hypothetical protein